MKPVITKSEAKIETPVGWLHIVANQNGVESLEFCKKPSQNTNVFLQLQKKSKSNTLSSSETHLFAALTQLKEYFAGERILFDLTLSPARGTEFQRRVWDALTEIPFGSTSSYKDVAQAIGSPQGMRAVGLANNKNPLPIIVPCHRVIGKSGDLVGYGGGLKKKEWLLRLEGII